MEIIREHEETGIAVVAIDDVHYVVRINHSKGQVYSEMPSDRPVDGGLWYGGLTNAGVQYVASPRSRAAALSGYRRAVKAQD